jgi:hypothetical protein
VGHHVRMPTIPHEAPVELVRRNPALAVALVQALGVAVPADAEAALASADATASVPAELRADAVVLLTGADGTRLAVIVEVQLRYDADKHFSWPAYVTQVRAAHRCPAVLLVICPNARTARRCRAPIGTGHPGFDLIPLVIDATTMPDPDQVAAAAGPEVVVLAVLTGALDLEQDGARRQVLAELASLDEERLTAYTVFILNAASPSARRALEELMTTTHPFFRNDFVDRWLNEGRAQGRAEGEARMIVRVLRARGVAVPQAVRRQILSCTDPATLAAWGERAATATSIDDVVAS